MRKLGADTRSMIDTQFRMANFVIWSNVWIECGSNGGGLLVRRARRCDPFHFEPCVMGYVCFDFIDCWRVCPVPTPELRLIKLKRPKHTGAADKGQWTRQSGLFIYPEQRDAHHWVNCGSPSSACTRRCSTPRPRRRNKAQKFEAFFSTDV